MANQEQLSILKQGVDVWNEWRAKHKQVGDPLYKPDLRGANLSDTIFRGILPTPPFSEEPTFRGANLFDGDLSNVDLTRADLRGAHLVSADLRGAYLVSADLRATKVYKAYLGGAHLHEANLSHASLDETNLGGADL